ncbi:MAG: hypothetical protein JJU27_12800 [Gammaproteobacteria bacterium]|nr:hypothetical protein [Gammaproteobacteria bacterium]
MSILRTLGHSRVVPIALALALLVPVGHAPAWSQAGAGLPLEVQVDLAIARIEQALIGENHPDTLAAVAELRELAPDLELPDLAFYEARALAGTDQPVAALERLIEFLAGGPRDSVVYPEALELMSSLETAAAQRQAAESRQRELDERLVWIESEIARREAEAAQPRRDMEWAQTALRDARNARDDFRDDVRQNCAEDWQRYNVGRSMGLRGHASRTDCIGFLERGGNWGGMSLRDHERSIEERRRALEHAQAGFRPHREGIEALNRERRELRTELAALGN